MLGLGNVLLGDDGFGPRVIGELAREPEAVVDADLLDGGTQGLGLLASLGGRAAVLIVDAYASGAEAGTLSVIESPSLEQLGARKSQTAHEGNAGELLSVAALTGDLPRNIILLGVEPERISVGMGLSPRVEQAVPKAVQLSLAALAKLRRTPACV
ncbi:MAG: hydrogenase maturation protease [Bryobacterales bacterium]